MKIQMFVIGALGLFMQVQAQKIMKKEVPLAVTSAFKKAFPTVKDIDWSKDGLNYEAQYDAGKMDNSVTYDGAGMLLETEMKIKIPTLPMPIMEYIKKNLNGAKVVEAAKITAANGTITYEAAVKGQDLIFDSNGNYIKTIIN